MAVWGGPGEQVEGGAAESTWEGPGSETLSLHSGDPLEEGDYNFTQTIFLMKSSN